MKNGQDTQNFIHSQNVRHPTSYKKALRKEGKVFRQKKCGKEFQVIDIEMDIIRKNKEER